MACLRKILGVEIILPCLLCMLSVKIRGSQHLPPCPRKQWPFATRDIDKRDGILRGYSDLVSIHQLPYIIPRGNSGPSQIPSPDQILIFRWGGGLGTLDQVKFPSPKSWPNFHFYWGEGVLWTKSNPKSQVLAKFSFLGVPFGRYSGPTQTQSLKSCPHFSFRGGGGGRGGGGVYS